MLRQYILAQWPLIVFATAVTVSLIVPSFLSPENAIEGALQPAMSTTLAEMPIVEYCLAPYTEYDADDDAFQDGFNRHQIGGAKYDFRPSIVTDKGAIAPGFGLFPYTVGQSGPHIEACFPANLDRLLTESEYLAIEAAFPGTSLVRGFSLGRVFFDLATVHADPSQTARTGPLRPTSKGKIDFFVGYGLFHSETFSITDHRAADVVKEAYGENYKLMREQTLAGKNPPESHLKYLGYLEQLYPSLDSRTLIPEGLPLENAIVPTTSNTDTFDDCAVGGSPTDVETACSGHLVLTEIASDCDYVVQSGSDDYIQQTETFATCEVRVDAAVSTDDFFTEATVRYLNNITGSQESAIFNRKACGDTTRTWYSFWWEVNPTAEFRIRERTGGSSADLTSTFTGASATADTDYVIKFETDGTNFEAFQDTVSILTTSDGSITGNLCGGWRLRSSTTSDWATLDDWTIEDLAAVTSTRRVFIWWPW